MINLIIWIIATVLGAILYRCGGSGRYPRWFRSAGVSFVGVGLLVILGGWNWWLILCYGLYFGSLTTYWKKTVDALWWNWALTGLGYSLAFLPFAIATGHWEGFIARTIIVTAMTAIWSESIGNPVVEECGRGAITTLTIPLLII
jgi:hypothetical protein